MSTVNRQHNFIFIHIPKTAGSSMETVSWMGEFYNKHEPISYYFRLSQFTKEGDLDLNQYFKWSFVRNPYTRFMSALTNHVLKGRYVTKQMEKYKDEKDYITEFIKNGDGFKNAEILKPMHEYLTLDGFLTMDFIGKFENLEEDFNKVCDLIGVPHTKLPHLVKGRYDDYDHLYTPETKEIIREYYSKDFERFNYE